MINETQTNRIFPLGNKVSLEIVIQETLKGRIWKQRIIREGKAGEWNYPFRQRPITRPVSTKEILDKCETDFIPKWIAMPKVRKLLEL